MKLKQKELFLIKISVRIEIYRKFKIHKNGMYAQSLAYFKILPICFNVYILTLLCKLFHYK